MIAFARLAAAQNVATGEVDVTVKDSKGALVTNATVAARDQAKAFERSTRQNVDGEYRLLALPPSTYIITVEAPGFAKLETTGVGLTVGQTLAFPITLQVSGGQVTVTVTTEGELVETSRTSTTNTIDERSIDSLPINGRNYINFTLTDSQIVRDNAPNVGAAPTSGLNMSGQRARSNLVNVDGADATDNSVNGVRSTVSQEAVQEFQIITNSYAPEYGRASGGIVNIITKSGTNAFHGDVFGYLRNRHFQAVNPFSTVKDPAYTRVQGGTAFGGPIKKDKTFFFFSFETTRRHETGFSSIGSDGYGLTTFPTPAGSVLLTPAQAGFFANSAVTPILLAPLDPMNPASVEIHNYFGLAAASSGMAVNGTWPSALVLSLTNGALSNWTGFPTSCAPPGPCVPMPSTFRSLQSQAGNFPVFEGTTLYSFRIDHNINSNHRLALRANVSPSTVTGIEVGGQDQPFGQNAYSRTSIQSYRDAAGTAQETWTIGTNKVNEFRFQYARRGLSYFYNTRTPDGSIPAVNITGFAYFGREPYSYIQRTEGRYQFTDNFSWNIGRHGTKFGADFNYLPLQATFTVNYGGVYDFGSVSASSLGLVDLPGLPSFPELNAVQAYGAGIPGSYVQGIGNPKDSFQNMPIGLFWQDAWRIRSNFTLNFGVRYDVEIPPKFKPPQGPLAVAGYNFLGLQKGIQTDKNNFQPRVGLAWDPKGDGKTVVRGSFGMFFDHPLLGLYFLGDASDGSSSGQLAFGGTGGCSFNKLDPTAGNPGNLNAIPIFQGLPINSLPSTPGAGICAVSNNPAVAAALGYLSNQQQFQSLNFPQSIFLNQNYLNPATFLPLGFQPFGYPQSKNFVYAYSQQANLTIERDLGAGFALSLAYNFNGGRHLNRPINSNPVRGDFMIRNLLAAAADPASGVKLTDNPFTVSACGIGPGGPYVPAALTNFFRPSGVNPSVSGALLSNPATAPCITGVPNVFPAPLTLVQQLYGLSTNCNVATFAGCVPFGDMDANYSNGSSVYHGLSANLRKRFNQHYEFLASYTWAHAIDDSTDLQSTTTPQDSFYPYLDRSNSTFDQRHRFVFSGVYQTGKLAGDGFGRKLLSNWTFAPIVEFASGRPFNIVTGNGDNLQLSSLTGRPNTVANPACGTVYKSKYSPTGILQEPCGAGFTGTLLSLDGNLGRNAGISPWTVFADLRVGKKIFFGERFNLEMTADIFNLPNRYNVSAVSPLISNAGQPTAAYDPRQFQFSLRLAW
jgi:hypothetical protein